jgi:HTH-type transcriptional regulator/antitoxin HigA
MQIQPIQTEAEYDAAVARITERMGARLGTEASDELEALVTIVDAYETEHFPMNEPDPETLRRFLLEQQEISE